MPTCRWCPGQLVNVTVQLNDIPGALVVPRDAVNDSPNGSFLFVVKDGKAEQVLVEVLTDDGTNAAVSGAGLRPATRWWWKASCA